MRLWSSKQHSVRSNLWHSDLKLSTNKSQTIIDRQCDFENLNMNEDTNTKMLFFGYIQYFLSCKINVSPSKSWTLQSQKNDCYPICWQSVCELFSQQCGEISSWPLLVRIGPHCNVQFAMSQAPSLLVIDGLRSFLECFVVPATMLTPQCFVAASA